MPAYLFSSINSGQASGFQAATDTLDFTGVTGATANNITVTQVGLGFELRIDTTQASVTLGSGAQGARLTLPDGSILILPKDASEQITGGAQNDHLYGGPQNDTLTGGAGADLLSGGSELDTFNFAPGDSGTVEGRLDTITDWQGGFEKIQFTTPMTGGDFTTLTAGSYSEALAAANQKIATGAFDVVAVQVGNDTYVFADTRNNNGGADDAIKLNFTGLNRMGSFNVLGYTPGPAGGGTDGGGATTPTPSAGNVTFETVSPAVALGYNAAVNDLVFSYSGAGATAVLVGFNGDGTVSVTSGAAITNQTVVFGSGIYGEANLVFPDGTRVVIGTPGDDLIIGAASHDRLFGGPGNDTLDGAGNGDGLFGGAGADLFVMPVRDTTATVYDLIYDWEPADRITFGGPTGATAANYREVDSATEAEQLITSGQADFVAIRSSGIGGAPVVTLWADVYGTNTITGRVSLQGATLDQISASNIVASPVLAFPALPPTPGAASTAAPGPVTYVGRDPTPGGGGFIEGNMDTLHLGDLVGGLASGDPTSFGAASNTLTVRMMGSGFSYLVQGDLLLDIPTGVVTSFYGAAPNPHGDTALGFVVNVSAPNVPASSVFSWITHDDTASAWGALFAGSDVLAGGQNADLLRGFGGNDTIGGNGGNDTLWGGTGDDVIYAASIPGRGSSVSGSTYLRGEEGDDNIYGGPGFDDINGNQGNDTAGGGPGDDWVVGGKDSDLLFGDAGNDLVYGNLGADTCDGGAGNDTVRGGQDNDVVRGGDGADFMSGDKGDDTVTGGAGADIFHTFGDAGIDRVTDFHASDGDRVMLDPGTQYTVSQSGADTVINMVGGGQMILVGVQMATLTPGWIFGA